MQFDFEQDSHEKSTSKKFSNYEFISEKSFDEDTYGDIQGMFSASSPTDIGENVQAEHPQEGTFIIVHLLWAKIL